MALRPTVAPAHPTRTLNDVARSARDAREMKRIRARRTTLASTATPRSLAPTSEVQEYRQQFKREANVARGRVQLCFCSHRIASIHRTEGAPCSWDVVDGHRAYNTCLNSVFVRRPRFDSAFPGERNNSRINQRSSSCPSWRPCMFLVCFGLNALSVDETVKGLAHLKTTSVMQQSHRGEPLRRRVSA